MILSFKVMILSDSLSVFNWKIYSGFWVVGFWLSDFYRVIVREFYMGSAEFLFGDKYVGVSVLQISENSDIGNN